VQMRDSILNTGYFNVALISNKDISQWTSSYKVRSKYLL
jgi:hypothetical protein